MPLTTFFGLLTLQVGVGIVAAVHFTIAGVILAANIFNYHHDGEGLPVSFIFMIVFAIGVFICAVLIFLSAYNETRNLALVSLAISVLLICYWLTLCCFSFMGSDSQVDSVCIHTRCPECFWIVSLYWRQNHIAFIEYWNIQRKNMKNTTTIGYPILYPHYFRSKIQFVDDVQNEYRLKRDFSEVHGTRKNIASEKRNMCMDINLSNISSRYTTGEEDDVLKITCENYLMSLNGFIYILRNTGEKTNTLQPNGNRLNKVAVGKRKRNSLSSHGPSNNTKLNQRAFNFQWSANETNKNYTGRKKGEPETKGSADFNFAFIGAIFLFVINLVYLLCSAYLMWSWASALDWADYYVEDDSPEIV